MVEETPYRLGQDSNPRLKSPWLTVLASVATESHRQTILRRLNGYIKVVQINCVHVCVFARLCGVMFAAVNMYVCVCVCVCVWRGVWR